MPPCFAQRAERRVRARPSNGQTTPADGQPRQRSADHLLSLDDYAEQLRAGNARSRRPGDYVNVPHLAEVERAALRVPKQGRAWLTLVRMPEVGTGAAGAHRVCRWGAADLPRPWPHGLAGRGRQCGGVVAGPVLEDGGMIGDRWGVSDGETLRSYPCDDFVTSPTLRAWRGGVRSRRSRRL
jgi:hypothetical protein